MLYLMITPHTDTHGLGQSQGIGLSTFPRRSRHSTGSLSLYLQHFRHTRILERPGIEVGWRGIGLGLGCLVGGLFCGLFSAEASAFSLALQKACESLLRHAGLVVDSM